nr:uncharacterized protein LOC105644832 [Ipomoea trifida]
MFSSAYIHKNTLFFSSPILFLCKSLARFLPCWGAFTEQSEPRKRQLYIHLRRARSFSKERASEMADWGPVVIAVVLFVLLSPGLLFQLPGRGRVVEFGNMQTSGLSILVHTIIFFGLITIFLIAIGVHIYTG